MQLENNPLLAKLTWYIFYIRTTSVESERVFSTTRDIFSAQRASLDYENVDMLSLMF